jgi:hypothetical protein
MEHTMASLGLGDVKKLVSVNNLSTVLSNEFIVCLIWKECGFDPRPNQDGSSAIGMMQLTRGAVAEVNKLPSRFGQPFRYEDMTDNAKNIQCGTLYPDLRIKWAKNSISAGVNGYGTGQGYVDNILACEACMKKPLGGINCLMMIHP